MTIHGDLLAAQDRVVEIWKEFDEVKAAVLEALDEGERKTDELLNDPKWWPAWEIRIVSGQATIKHRRTDGQNWETSTLTPSRVLLLGTDEMPPRPEPKPPAIERPCFRCKLWSGVSACNYDKGYWSECRRAIEQAGDHGSVWEHCDEGGKSPHLAEYRGEE
jgi:hypothetical protein